MTDVNKPLEIPQSQQQTQQQQQPQQPQQQQQQSQQMMIASHEIQQQNVQQQQVQQQQVQQQPQQQAQQQQQMQVQQAQQQQAANGPHNVVTATSNMSQQQLQGVAVSMHQHQAQQQQPQQVNTVSMALAGQQGATTITTMAAHPQAVQVIQQPLQNQAYHLQQLYNSQGTPLIMPGNLALHPANINPSSIQVITASKPFQSAGQLTPHMLTTASAGQGVGHPGSAGAKVQGFPAGYLPIPTSGTPGGAQTLVLGQLGVLNSAQASHAIQQQQQQQANNNKQDQVQKYTTCNTATAGGQRGANMQFAPWPFTPQVWTAGLQQPTLLTAGGNQIFIRGPAQSDMFIQSPQPIQAHNALATQQQIQGVQQIAASGKPRVMDIQQQQGKQTTVGQRPLSILPSSLQGMQPPNIRPASSVSTQTAHGVATIHTQSGGGGGKGSGGAGKGRGKPVVRTSPSPTATTKADAANQTKSNAPSSQQHATTGGGMMMQTQQVVAAVQANNSGGGSNTSQNKILVAANNNNNNNNAPVVNIAQPPGPPMSNAAATDKPNFASQMKTVMQTTQQTQPQTLQQQQQQQQVFIQQMQHMQQQHQLQHYQQQQHQQQQQQQSTQPQIQPKPIMGMTLQQQQQGVVLGGGERPIMPVVSMGGVTTLQMNQVQQPQMQTVQQLQLPTLSSTIISNQLMSGAQTLQTLQATDLQQPLPSATPAPLSLPLPPTSLTLQQQPSNVAAASVPTSAAAQMDTSSLERIQQQQDDCSLMPPPPSVPPPPTPPSLPATPASTEESKKETLDEGSTPMEVVLVQDSDGTSSKDGCKESKQDERCTNPLAGMANTVNSIANGVCDDSAMSVTTAPLGMSKQTPPKAMVKPQVLTHVIEGFVIQEASEPFAVNRSSMNGSFTLELNNGQSCKNNSTAIEKDLKSDEPPKKRHAPNYLNDGSGNNSISAKCEACGVSLEEQGGKLKKDKRFCSTSCAKNKKREKRDVEMGGPQWPEKDSNTIKHEREMKKNGEEKAANAIVDDEHTINPVKWTVNQVCDFIRNLPGCADYAEDFAIQEIDGQALMLLKEDHLMSAMSIKLGPALKIVARIESMRVDSSGSSSPTMNSNMA